MIFYDTPMAPSPRRARIILEEKNVAYETVIIDLSKDEQLSDEFKTINPSCTVPVLQLADGTILTENAGIAAYLDNAFPEPCLLGSTAIEKGLIADWNAKIEFTGLLAVAEALRNSSPGMKGRALTGPVNWEQLPELAERGRIRVGLFYDMLNARLKDREFIATDYFSNADITALVTIDFANAIRLKPQEHHQDLIRWREDLNKRPSCVFKKG